MKVCIAVAAVLAAACSMQAMGQTNLLLTNPSFESQSGFVGGPNQFVDETTITGWRLTGVGDGSNSGNFSQILGVTNETTPFTGGKDGDNFAYNVRGIFETAAANRAVVTAGLTYQFAFIAEADFDNLNTSGRFSIDWYDSTSGYTPISSSSELLVIPELGRFQEFSVQGVAPAGALFAAVKYDSTNEGTGTSGTNAWFDRAVLSEVTVPAFVLGDFNFDGGVDASDIDPFVVAANEGDPFAGYIASSEAAFGLLYPGQTLTPEIVNQIGDFNGDGGVDASDIDPFVVFANNGGSGVAAIPEPATLGIVAMAGLLVGRRRR